MNENENFLCGIGIGLICAAPDTGHMAYVGLGFCLWGLIPCLIRQVREAGESR